MEWHNPFSQPLFWVNLKKTFNFKGLLNDEKRKGKKGFDISTI